jgi:hypothetical protein
LDRHAALLQLLAHTQLAQRANGIAWQVQAQPNLRRSVQPINQHGRDSPLIEGAYHGEPGDATTDNEYATGSAAWMPHASTLACGEDPENGFYPALRPNVSLTASSDDEERFARAGCRDLDYRCSPVLIIRQTVLGVRPLIAALCRG